MFRVPGLWGSGFRVHGFVLGLRAIRSSLLLRVECGFGWLRA